MIPLAPSPQPFHDCPYCHVPLAVDGWYIPGMRNLADLQCQRCRRLYYGDLLSGHGLFYPMLLEKESGRVFDRYGGAWFADCLKQSYARRQDSPLELVSETLRPLKRPMLLNCLDMFFGHSVLRLLNAQYYIDHCPSYDLVVLIPRFLRWMVPDGAAAIWTIDMPLRQGAEWSDWLGRELRRRCDQYDEVWLSVGFSHPHPDDYDIVRFTRVAPFPIEEWDTRMERPTVTFILREDRLWLDDGAALRRDEIGRRIWRRISGRLLDPREPQVAKLSALAERLRRQVPRLHCVVAGIGVPTGMPDWVCDLRRKAVNAEIEREWCEQYAKSHVVVGVHGSNMLLPSAHAGAVVELVPADRWGNLLQDFLFRPLDARLTCLLYRTLPLSTSIADVCDVIASLLQGVGSHQLGMHRDWTRHREPMILDGLQRRQLRRSLGHTLS